ncbi:MAG: hypothetical protein ACK5UM_18710 [Pseudomonadota bacterium]|nr:hypothetical protein [Rubrivivax sp.]MCA3257035.1 hypothetical protein [Rubrivivax sp.]MCZ8029380.1 hypothetical protein [Rubrivivax sp.]
MPGIAELAVHAALLGLIAAAVNALRRAQPDPNPAIEAREAAAQAAAQAAGLSVPELLERRKQSLPFVGRDRREQLESEAAAWRRSA